MRQLDIAHRGAQIAHELDGTVTGCAHSRIEVGREILPRQADGEPAQILPGYRELHRGSCGRRGVERVVP
jgi:hypothetical protein